MSRKIRSTKMILTGVTLVLSIALVALAACAPASLDGKVAASSSGVAVSTAGDALVVTAPATAISDEIPVMSKHDDQGVKCITCHDTETPTSAPASDGACLTCHNSDILAASTASMEDVSNRQVNPHDNHMHGTSCFSCHSNHGASTVACNECHTNEYNWLVP